MLTSGDVLVAETNAPPKPEDAQGIKGWLMGLFYGDGGRWRAQRQPHRAVTRH
jgi:hypothetical protein